MDIEEKIEKTLKELKQEGIYSEDFKCYPDNNSTDFEKLINYKLFLEIKNIQTNLWESYTKTKYYLKELASEDGKVPDKSKEIIFYEWLKICVNPQGEKNYDFYFEKNKLDKENEVKGILFENNGDGPLKDTFTQQDWQIRLRTIADWFLKRYDSKTASKILKNIQSPYKNIFDRIKLLTPRLWGAIFIGFLPLIVGQETWDLPLKFLNVSPETGWIWVAALSALFVLISFGYLIIECYNITRNTITAIKRAGFVCLEGFLISLIFSSIIVYVMGEYSVSESLKVWGWNPLGRKIFSANILFFASAALLIGIFIQVFWEEKTITEPL